MAEWRDILNRAADNLSVDLNHSSQPSFRQQPAGWPAQRPGLGQAPFVASRDRLARELEAVSGLAPSQQRPQARLPQQRLRAMEAPATAHRASITQAIGQPAQAAAPAQVQAEVYVAPAAKKSGSGREIAALFTSVGIVALAVYGFFVLLH
jgi:cell envelope opacity-associated protein A